MRGERAEAEGEEGGQGPHIKLGKGRGQRRGPPPGHRNVWLFGGSMFPVVCRSVPSTQVRAMTARPRFGGEMHVGDQTKGGRLKEGVRKCSSCHGPVGPVSRWLNIKDDTHIHRSVSPSHPSSLQTHPRPSSTVRHRHGRRANAVPDTVSRRTHGSQAYTDTLTAFKRI